MRKNTAPLRTIRFTLTEKLGDLPYTVSWISLDGRIRTRDYGTLYEAEGHRDHLVALGVRPSSVYVKSDCCSLEFEK